MIQLMRVQSSELFKIMSLFDIQDFTIAFESINQWYVVEFESKVKYIDVYTELKYFFQYRLVEDYSGDNKIIVKFELM
jgi:hypothetical protein